MRTECIVLAVYFPCAPFACTLVLSLSLSLSRRHVHIVFCLYFTKNVSLDVLSYYADLRGVRTYREFEAAYDPSVHVDFPTIEPKQLPRVLGTLKNYDSIFVQYPFLEKWIEVYYYDYTHSAASCVTDLRFQMRTEPIDDASVLGLDAAIKSVQKLIKQTRKEIDERHYELPENLQKSHDSLVCLHLPFRGNDGLQYKFGSIFFACKKNQPGLSHVSSRLAYAADCYIRAIELCKNATDVLIRYEEQRHSNIILEMEWLKDSYIWRNEKNQIYARYTNPDTQKQHTVRLRAKTLSQEEYNWVTIHDKHWSEWTSEEYNNPLGLRHAL